MNDTNTKPLKIKIYPEIIKAFNFVYNWSNEQSVAHYMALRNNGQTIYQIHNLATKLLGA